LLKYGVTKAEIQRVLDMRELQAWVVRLMEEERLSIISKTWKDNGLKATVAVGILTFLWVSAPMVRSICTFIIEYFIGIAYQVRQQCEMAGVAYRKGMYSAGIFLTLSVMLDLLQRWMQISTTASWILPQESPLQSCMFPFVTWSLTTDMLVPKDVLAKSPPGQGQGPVQGGGFGMNMAPMIFMGVTGYLKSKLQEWGTKPIADYVLNKAKRKGEKKEKLKHEQEQREAQEAQKHFSMDDDDEDADGLHASQDAPHTEEYRQAFRQAVDESFRASAARATYIAASAMDPAKQGIHDRYAESMRSGDISFLDQRGAGDVSDAHAKVRWADDIDDADRGGCNDETEEVLTGKTSRK